MAESESGVDTEDGIKTPNPGFKEEFEVPPARPSPKMRVVKQSDTPERIADIYGVKPDAIKGEVRPGKVVTIDIWNAIGKGLGQANEILNLPGAVAGTLAKQFGKAAIDPIVAGTKLTQKAFETGEVDPGETFQVALDLGVGGLSTSAAVGVHGSLGMFVGPKGNLTKKQKADYEEIKAMEKDGLVDEDSIWHQKGWFKDPRGDWKTEVPLKKANFRFSNTSKGTTLDDVMVGQTSERLYSYYPDLKKVKVVEEPMNFGAYYDAEEDLIAIPKDQMDRIRALQKAGKMDEAKKWMRITASSIKHEVQHAIQTREGWDRGTNPNAAHTAVMQSAYNRYEKAIKSLQKKYPEANPQLMTMWVQNKIVPDTPAEAQVKWYLQKEPEMMAELYYAERDYHTLNPDPIVESQFEGKYGPQTVGKEAYMRKWGEAEARLAEIRDNPRLPDKYHIDPMATTDVDPDKTWFTPK